MLRHRKNRKFQITKQMISKKCCVTSICLMPNQSVVHFLWVGNCLQISPVNESEKANMSQVPLSVTRSFLLALECIRQDITHTKKKINKKKRAYSEDMANLVKSIAAVKWIICCLKDTSILLFVMMVKIQSCLVYGWRFYKCHDKGGSTIGNMFSSTGKGY